MKKILFIALFVLAVIELNAHGACLVEQLKLQKSCTGGAAPIPDNEENEYYKYSSTKEILKDMYQIPSISTPRSYSSDGFPIINPAANCMFGVCNPR